MADQSPNTTELDAVNTMLDTIGEAAITSLDGTLPADAASAKSILAESSRSIQIEGWDFNTDKYVEFPLNEAGEIPVTGSVLRVNFPERPTNDVKRGGRLYNKTDQTFTYTSPRTATDVVYFRQWDDLPEEARQYIMIRAARVFTQRRVGARELVGFSDLDERIARGTLVSAQLESGNYNMLTRPQTGLRRPRKRA